MTISMGLDWKRYIGRHVTLFYDDFGRVVPKVGILMFANSTHLFLVHDRKEEGIAISKIVRLEVIRGDDLHGRGKQTE